MPLPVVVLMAASSPWSQLVVEYLARSGFAVHVVDFNDSAAAAGNPELYARSIAALRSRVESVQVIATPRPLLARTVVGAWRLRRVARQCHARMVLALYGGMQAAIACVSGFRPYAVYVVGSDVLLADRVRRFISRVSLARARAVLANGGHLADKTREIAPGAPVELLYLGTDLRRFQPPPVPNHAPRFVCSRAFAPVYDNGTIVRALAVLEAVPEAFELSFLSAGPLLDETIALADHVVPPAVRRAVSFAGGVSQQDLIAALRAATFYISASRSDGASASLLEAMACGLFPIVSDIPANREWITHEANGLLFVPGDHRALARCIERACAGAPWMDAAVAANLRLVAERGNVEVNLPRLRDLLVQAAAQGRPRPMPAGPAEGR